MVSKEFAGGRMLFLKNWRSSFCCNTEDQNGTACAVYLTGPCKCVQIDMCCFDIFGTLTPDTMVMECLTDCPGRGQVMLANMKQATMMVL